MYLCTIFRSIHYLTTNNKIVYVCYILHICAYFFDNASCIYLTYSIISIHLNNVLISHSQGFSSPWIPTGRYWGPISWVSFTSCGFPWRGFRCISHSYPHTGWVRGWLELAWKGENVFFGVVFCWCWCLRPGGMKEYRWQEFWDTFSKYEFFLFITFSLHSLHAHELNHIQYINNYLLQMFF